MSPHKVVVCRDIGKEALSILQIPELEVILWPEHAHQPASRNWILDNIVDASGIIVMVTDKVDQELLEKGSKLQVVSTVSVGYGESAHYWQGSLSMHVSDRNLSTEHIDTRALAKRNIKLGYTPDVLTDAVADVAIMLALMASRNVKEALSVIYEGNWPTIGRSPFPICGPQIGFSPAQKSCTIGFLGFGRIARATLDRLVPFGVTRCLYTTSGRSPHCGEEFTARYGFEVKHVTQDEVARESDFLFALVPGGTETRHLVNEAFLRKMKLTSILINPSRGTVVDSYALAKALKEKWIWGAGLDVLEGEPNISLDHPLLKEPRAIVLPHLGSATIETRMEMAKLAARNLVNGLMGREMEALVKQF